MATTMFDTTNTTAMRNITSQAVARNGAMSYIAAKSPWPNSIANVLRCALETEDQSESSTPKSTQPPNTKFSEITSRIRPKWKRSLNDASRVRPMTAMRGCPMKALKKRTRMNMVYQNIPSLWYSLKKMSQSRSSMMFATFPSYARATVEVAFIVVAVAGASLLREPTCCSKSRRLWRKNTKKPTTASPLTTLTQSKTIHKLPQQRPQQPCPFLSEASCNVQKKYTLIRSSQRQSTTMCHAVG
mmetsp:Transcript_88723/g.246427  ORF Transcript_88723/g.246427 Transcript_88723/m.246427 type:complete len:243 (+) Transcript_88723:841-1569(+)